MQQHVIPPITHPLGQYWDQPDRRLIEIDATHALTDPYTFGELKDYSRSQPSGAYEGKMWKAQHRGQWHLLWFDFSDDGNPDMVSVRSRILEVVA